MKKTTLTKTLQGNRVLGLIYATTYVVIHKLLFIIAVPVVWINEQIQWQKYKREKKRLLQVKQWIIEHLTQKGIKVIGEWSNYVNAELKSYPDQINDFQTVYAEAIKQFPDVPPDQFCAWAKPLGLLDKEWAKRFGFKEYQGMQWTAPCYGCKKQVVKNFLWGDDSPRDLYVENYHFVLKPEFREKGPGFICKECWPKYFNR